MKGTKLAGAMLLVLGLLALVYGGFTYSKEETDARIGPVKIEVQEKKRVNVPVWAGAAAVLAGAVLLARKS
jgi:drug/metabolite transporter (DMT)-like permease